MSQNLRLKIDFNHHLLVIIIIVIMLVPAEGQNFQIATIKAAGVETIVTITEVEIVEVA